MRFWSIRQLFLLILGAIVALGMDVSTIVSSDFAMRNVQTVAMMDDMAAVNCPDSGKSEPCESSIPCAVICAGPALSLAASDGLVLPVAPRPGFVIRAAKLLVGSSAPPELSPPRTTYIA